MLRYLLSVLFGAGTVLMSPASAADMSTDFDRLVVIGDSLSDIGNAGRFSNGPVWVEHLAGALDLPLAPAQAGGTNFAVGGARLDPRSGPFNLRAQADMVLATAPPAGRTLHVVWGGGNDLLAAVGMPDGEAMVDIAVASLRGIVADLIEAGATDILLPSLPDVGMTPAVRSYGAMASARARELSLRFNGAMDRMLAGLDTRGARLYRLDVMEMADRARAEPASYGFTNIDTPCGGLRTCEGYVFWDSIHPTTQAHARLADGALRVLNGEPAVR